VFPVFRGFLFSCEPNDGKLVAIIGSCYTFLVQTCTVWMNGKWKGVRRITMKVVLQLPPATERVLKEKAARSGQTLETYLQHLAEREAGLGNGPTAAEDGAGEWTPEQWSAAWRAWAAGFPTRPTEADDSRESIYVGRGE
jgi:hypothetical protein